MSGGSTCAPTRHGTGPASWTPPRRSSPNSGRAPPPRRRAGVAIGTVFRHFPTKNELLAAIMKRLLDRLAASAGQLGGGDGLFAFFTGLVAEAADKRAVVELLARGGVEIRLPETVGLLES